MKRKTRCLVDFSLGELTEGKARVRLIQVGSGGGRVAGRGASIELIEEGGRGRGGREGRGGERGERGEGGILLGSITAMLQK